MNSGIPFYQIIPVRLSRHTTISNYSSKQVFESLLDSLLCNKTEETMYWVSEILCSGYTDKLWIFAIEFYSMYIHVFYPSIIVYIHSKHIEYKHMKKNTKKGNIHNNIKLREFLFRIFYIFSIINKKFLIKLFHSDIFNSFDTLYDCHKALTKNDDILMDEITTGNADEIVQVLNHNMKEEINHALSQLKQSFQEFVDSYGDDNDKTKLIVYNWLSFLLEKGFERFSLYQNNQHKIHLKHDIDENKYSYFIWIIWNVLLEHHKKFPIKNEIMALYRVYENYKNNQSTNAYMIIILAYILCLEKIAPKKINIDNNLYNESKLYFYNTFGYIQEATNGRTRKDKI